MTTGAGPSAAGRFAEFARAARGTAFQCQAKNDLFGARVATARAEVYEQAAELVGRLSEAEAARRMFENAKAIHVRTPPLLDFDAARVRYLQGRAWQFCAWQLDPALPVGAPSWDH